MLPEPYNGERSWEEWDYHFGNAAEVNSWDDHEKLLWLKVRLTGRAQKALQRLPAASRASYAAMKAALQERYEPKSRKTRYQAEFQTRRKKKTKGWDDFSEDLKMLTDKAYPELE